MPPGKYTMQLADKLALSQSRLAQTQNLDGRDRTINDAQVQADAAYQVATTHGHHQADTNMVGFARDNHGHGIGDLSGVARDNHTHGGKDLPSGSHNHNIAHPGSSTKTDNASVF